MITDADIVNAYNRLKSYVYYDNMSLGLRLKIAQYEDEKTFDKLFCLAKELNNYFAGNKSQHINELLNSIAVTTLPKKFNTTGKDARYISNKTEFSSYKIETFIHFIDCSVEIHIISFLWIINIGTSIDRFSRDNCFAYRLVKNNESEKCWNKRTFSKYFDKYQEWRDRAINEAQKLYHANEGAIIVSLDIKNYYDTVDLDINTIDSIDIRHIELNKLLGKIHNRYRQIRNKKNNILPIGLISSGILANYYLYNFDDRVTKKLKPKYYGRYVDDILIVLRDTNKYTNINDILNSYFIKNNLLIDSNDSFLLSTNENLCLQKDKLKLYHFLPNEPLTILNEFKRNIRKNSSEFRFFPDEGRIFKEVSENSFQVIYSDTINKLRSIEGISTNKYGASKHLANILFVLKYTHRISRKNRTLIHRQIEDLFKGRRCVELSGLWSKVILIYTITKDLDNLIKFISYVTKHILKLTYKEPNKAIDCQVDLMEQLRSSLSMAVALDFPLFDEKFDYNLKQKFSLFDSSKTPLFAFVPLINLDIWGNAKNLISSNLFNHVYSSSDLIYLCKQREDFSFRAPLKPDTNFNFDEIRIKLFPRFILYHEVSFFCYLKQLSSGSFQASVKDIHDKYIKINRLPCDDIGRNTFFPVLDNSTDNQQPSLVRVVNEKDHKKDSLKISIVNMEVYLKNSLASFRGHPNLYFERLMTINKILNLSLKESVDLIVFPEISIPYMWLDNLATFARKNNIGIACGVEHITNYKKEVINYSCLMLPFANGSYKNVYIDLRPKVDYSHEEVRQIVNRHGFKLPPPNKDNDLKRYYWNGAYFTLFNCFELADIEKRATFKGKIDFIIAIEHNRDTPYFSNIVDSVARDIHSFVIQVNNSKWGDSRISQPAESFNKDIIKIKGGHNDTIITGQINIKQLREFQMLKYELQKDNFFKPTPPQFTVSDDRVR